jgi:EAL domain-containing protein (putative c-di-GMP-specific phosphodiesterase class I)
LAKAVSWRITGTVDTFISFIVTGRATIHDFPFVEIKVDRQFIAGCADDRLRQTVCRQILDLADGFGARTVAEGVETRADFFAVREMDFDMVQGFLFAKPVTAQKFALTTLRQPVTMPL